MTDLTHASDENLAVHASWAPRQSGARVQLDDELALVDSGLPCDTFNFICRARLAAATARRRINDGLVFFGETGHPFSWWLGPGFTPPDLPALLESAGLERVEGELAMSVDLGTLHAAAAPVPGLRIERVTTDAALETYARLSAANWDPPDRWVVEFYRRFRSALLAPASPQSFYVGYLDDAPVATAESTVGGGVVGLYGISTRPQYRGLGIGTAMTLAPLLDAQRAGWPAGILQAAEAGVGLYRRLGFVAFGDIAEYKLPVPAP